jgi:competence ComEA-like helix-hairpin-helix protein
MAWKEYFTFTKGQSIAILILSIIIFVGSFLYFLLPQWTLKYNSGNSDKIDEMIAQLQVDSATANQNYSYSKDKEDKKPQKLTPFMFDPNTLDEAGFLKLGLRDKLVATLLNYRNKGGKFYNKESLKRIYGLHPEEYAQLEPYINIPGSYNSKSTNNTKTAVTVELNRADTSQLVMLNGIGSKLAMNIVKYRTQLGGYVRLEQLNEVYGISPETYQKIKGNCKVDQSMVKKLNLNEATFAELNLHPYLKGEIAKSIADFRKSKNYHIDNIHQLKEIQLINDEIFRKIAPYLIVQ